MKFIFLRHGEASFDAPTDQQRELTDRGIAQVEWLANHLGQLHVSKVFCSPYVRTQQTLKTLLPNRKHIELVEWLTPDTNPAAAMRELQNVSMSLSDQDAVLCVTHQPLISSLISAAIGSSQPMMPSSCAITECELFGSSLAELISVVHPSEHVR